MKYLYLDGSNCSACSPVLLHFYVSDLETALTDNLKTRKLFPDKILTFCFLGKSILYSLLQTISVDFTESQDHRMAEVYLTCLTWHLCYFIKAKTSWNVSPFPSLLRSFSLETKQNKFLYGTYKVLWKCQHSWMVLKGQRILPVLPWGSLCFVAEYRECVWMNNR